MTYKQLCSDEVNV